MNERVGPGAGLSTGGGSAPFGSLRLLRMNASPNNGHGIKNLLTNHRHNILNHLPGAIGIGNILNDGTLDDRTNKMEGPVSSLMHAIEKQFASTNIAKEKKD